jgi:hypothetical protein
MCMLVSFTGSIRLQPSNPPEQTYPNCIIKAIAVHNSVVYIGMLNKAAGASEIVCANTGQSLTVPGQLEDLVVRSVDGCSEP